MPIINGRFYINPAHGRAIERARHSESVRAPIFDQLGHSPLAFTKEVASRDQSQDSNGHWVTIDGRHVFIDETKSGGRAQPGHRRPRPIPIQLPANENERRLAVIVFNETGGLTPSTAYGRGSGADLHTARVALAEISKREIEAGHATRVAPDEIETGLWQGLNDKNQHAIGSWNDSLSAAREAIGGSNIANNASQFRLDAQNGGIPSWAQGRSPSLSFGPFRNAGGGDAATPATRIHIYQ